MENDIYFHELENIEDRSDFDSFADRIRIQITVSGLDFAQACMMEGVSSLIVGTWQKELKTDDPRPELLELRDKAQRAEVELEQKLFKEIMNDGSPKDKSWLMEKRFPDKYGKKPEKHEHDGAITIKLDLPEQLSKYGE